MLFGTQPPAGASLFSRPLWTATPATYSSTRRQTSVGYGFAPTPDASDSTPGTGASATAYYSLLQSITADPAFSHLSFEELRWADIHVLMQQQLQQLQQQQQPVFRMPPQFQPGFPPPPPTSAHIQIVPTPLTPVKTPPPAAPASWSHIPPPQSHIVTPAMNIPPLIGGPLFPPPLRPPPPPPPPQQQPQTPKKEEAGEKEKTAPASPYGSLPNLAPLANEEHAGATSSAPPSPTKKPMGPLVRSKQAHAGNVRPSIFSAPLSPGSEVADEPQLPMEEAMTTTASSPMKITMPSSPPSVAMAMSPLMLSGSIGVLSPTRRPMPRRSPLQTAQPRVVAREYYTVPDSAALAAMTEDELSRVAGFRVGCNGLGEVRWTGETDVRGIDICTVVVFGSQEVRVYPAGTEKPPIGRGLNKEAEITLHSCWPKAGREASAAEFSAYAAKIARVTEQYGATFVSYSRETGDWTFRVTHFSRYGLPVDDDDEEEQDEGEGAAAAAAARPAAIGRAQGVEQQQAATRMRQSQLRTEVPVEQPSTSAEAGEEEGEEAAGEKPSHEWGQEPPVPDGMPEGEEAREEQEEEQQEAKEQVAEEEVVQGEGEGEEEREEEEGEPLQRRPRQPPLVPGFDQAILPGTMTPIDARTMILVRGSLMQGESRGQRPAFEDTEAAHMSLWESAADESMQQVPIALAAAPARPPIPPTPLAHPPRQAAAQPDLGSAPIRVPFAQSIAARLQRPQGQPAPGARAPLPDAALVLCRGFRVGWAPGGMLPAILQRTERSGQAVLPVRPRCVRPIDVEAQVALEAHLSASRRAEHAAAFTLEDMPGLVSRLADGATSDHHRQLWSLVRALFCDPAAPAVTRRRRVDAWLRDALAADTRARAEAHIFARRPNDAIFTAMCGRQLSVAVQTALAAGEPRLATLLSQADGSVAFRELLDEQVARSKKGSYPVDVQRIYKLLAAQVTDPLVWEAVSDWRACFGLHLWYGTPRDSDVAEAIAAYEQAATKEGAATPPRSPFDRERPDAIFSVMRLFAHKSEADVFVPMLVGPAGYSAGASVAADHSVAWLLLTVFESIGLRPPAGVAESVTCAFAEQLEESPGAWPWAIYVLLHGDRGASAARQERAAAVVGRHGASMTLADRALLRDRLRVPAAWIGHACSWAARAAGRPWQEVGELVGAGLWEYAHARIMEELAPAAVLDGAPDTVGRLHATLTIIKGHSAEISSWNTGGGMILRFLDISQKEGGDGGDGIDERIHGLQELCKDITQFGAAVATRERHSPNSSKRLRTDRAFAGVVAGSVARMLRDACLPRRAGDLLPFLKDMPLPDDVRLEICQDAIFCCDSR